MLKTIAQLITALESGDYQQAKGQFHVLALDVRQAAEAEFPSIIREGWCCLGVYADISEIPQRASVQAVFGWPGDDLFVSRAQLPTGHWLLEKVHISEGAFRSGGYDVQFQSFLSDINDEEADMDTADFTYTVRALKAYRDGRRVFPSSTDFIEELEAA